MKGVMTETMGKPHSKVCAQVRKETKEELAERVVAVLKDLKSLYDYYTTELRENNDEKHRQAKLGNLEQVIYHEALAEAYKDHRHELISMFNTLKLGVNAEDLIQ